jgi:glucose-1-phosphate thymidylyltransferase
MTLKTKGILLAGGKGTRLSPITNVLNKHLIPVYDKPMIYYPLSTIMMCGIREIAIVTNPEDVYIFKKLLGNGSDLGLELEYFVQEKPNGLPEAFTITEEFTDGCRSVLMLGDNLLIGQGLGTTLETHLNKPGASILAFPVTNPQEYGVVEFDSNGKVVSIEEKPQIPKSHYAIPGIYFMDERAPHFSRSLTPSSRGELEITDLLRCYLSEDQLSVTTIKRGTGWMDAGTTESLYSASELVRVLQNRQGFRFNVPEEIAFNRGWISADDLLRLASRYSMTSYGEYLKTLIKS